MVTRRGEQGRPPRRRRAGGAAASTGPLLRGLPSAGAGYVVDFDVRPVFDFVLSPSALDEERDLLAEDQRWLEESFASLSGEEQEAVKGALGEGGYGQGLDILLVQRPEVRRAEGLVRAVEEASSTELLAALLADALPPESVERAVAATVSGDQAALAAVEAELSEWNRDVVARLLRDPDDELARLRVALRAWLPRFAAIEQRVSGMIERDFAERLADRASLAPSELIERTTGGIRFLPDGRTRRVILAPSYFSRPYNYISAGPDWRIFCYPLAEAALGGADPLVPPASAVRLFRALGDDTRLRVLKLLSSRDWYLTELATELQLSKPTMKHHLALLRAAGLVTIVEEGALIYYSLRRERLEEGGAELRRYLA